MTETGTDPRKLADLVAEWHAGPRDDPPSREDFERLTEVRSAMFAKMSCPASIRTTARKSS